MVSNHFLNEKRQLQKSQERPKFNWPKLRKAIEFYQSEHLCYLPADWGHKDPSVDGIPLTWKPFQARLPTLEEKASWFHEGKATNIGVVCGGISRGLVILAFNDQDGAREFFGEEQWQKLPQITFVTKSRRGVHVWLRSDLPIKSQPIGKDKNASWLEIRSDGNFTVAPPSLHPSGVLYEAIGVNNIYKSKDLAGFITKRLSELGLKATKPEAEQAKGKITQGERNTQLTSLAGAMRRRGISQSVLETTLLEINATQCEPPLPTSEVMEIAKSVARYEPTTGHFNLTDTGNAERLTKRYGDRLHYSEARKKWLVWNGKVWQWNYGAKIMAFSKRTARAIYTEAANETDDEERKAILKHAAGSEKKDRRVAMVDLSISEPNIAIELDELDTNPWLFCCKNGTIDLRTGELKPHDKDDLITKMSPVEYDPDAQCSLWQKFLARITDNDTELQGYLQRATGYSLCGDTRAQVLFFLYGAGNNGKSTYLNTISKIIAGYSHKAPMEIFATKGRQESTTESLANLQGKRFVYAGEVEEGRRLRLNLIKDITGGEPIRADRKYEHEIEFLPTFKLWLYGNHKPFVVDNTIATWRRLREIPFTVVIPDDEIDQELPKKLEAEQSGILTWMVKGCLDWQRRALSEPAAVNIATNAYRAEMDILREFIEDCCIIQPTATATKKDLYNAYKQWCADNNNQSITKRTFGTRLGERGITDKKVHEWFWCGIRLNDTTQGTFGDIKSENTGTFLHRGVEGKFPQNSESMSLNVPTDTKSGGIKPENTGFPITKNGKKPEKCPVCGGTDFWKRVTGEWVCANCHPQPQEIDMEV